MEFITPSLASHPQVFHGGCFGVYGTPPGEAVSCCEIGTTIPLVPRLSIGTLCIRWRSWLTFGWRVQTCVQVNAWCLDDDSSRSQPGGLAPVSIAVDTGVFSCCEGRGQDDRWLDLWMVSKWGWDSNRKKEEALLPWSGEQGFLWENWPSKRLGGHQRTLLVFVSRYGETPILCRIGGHDTLAIATEAATVSGTQNLSQSLNERG